MPTSIRSVVVPVSDLEAAKAIYTALLGTPHTDEPYYVGYNVNGFEVALNPQGTVADGPIAYTDVDDLDAVRATLLAAGATERTAPVEVGPGARICVLEDADGNAVGLRGK
ncbi:VOC family protein [Yinghuangia sp. YIM S09857]|uniref:VOC family protein n=1 Tax=Yinghuangia sp. YIM S09857 TaxID=3436929 RepID=UPI003F53813F